MSPLRAGFLGVGQMGRPMVERLLAAGIPVTAHVRRPELAAELAAAGVTVAASAAEVAAAADVLCVCLFSDTQLREVLLGAEPVLAAMRPDARLVSHVTGSPALAEELAAMLPPGARYVDAPMSGSADDILAGRLTLLVGAAADDLEAVRPVIATYASTIVHVGGVGDGQRAKLVNNLMFTVNLRIALEAARLGRTLGIEPADLARSLAACSGNSYALALFAHRSAEELVAGARPYLAKDVAVVRAVAGELGTDLGLIGDLARWVDTGL